MANYYENDEEKDFYGDYTGISNNFKEFMENLNTEETHKVKEFFNAIDESFNSLKFDENVEYDVTNYLNNYDKELEIIQNTYQEQMELYQAQVDIEKDKLEQFLISSYGAEGAQMMEKIDNPNGIDAAELERIRQQVEKENEEEAKRIEAFQNLVKDLAISVAVVSIVNEEKENFNEIKDKIKDKFSIKDNKKDNNELDGL